MSYAIGWNKPLDMNTLILTGWICSDPVIKETYTEGQGEHRYLSFILRYRESLSNPYAKRKQVTTSLPVLCRSKGVLSWAEKSLEKGHRIAINGRLGIRMIKDKEGKPIILPFGNKALMPFIEAWSITILHLSYAKPDQMPESHPRYNPMPSDPELQDLVSRENIDSDEEIW